MKVGVIMGTIYKPTTKATAITAILYEEKLPANFGDILLECGYAYVVSPLHSPDAQKNDNGELSTPKEHRHILLYSGRSDRYLDYKRVDVILEALNPQHAHAFALSGGSNGMKFLMRYFVHRTKASADKQQFDLRNPLTCYVPVDDKGICSDTGLLNIFDENKGFIDGNGLNFINAITLTIREKAEEIKEDREAQLSDILDYIYSEHCFNFADLALWCRGKKYLATLTAYASIIRPILADMKNSQYWRDSVERPAQDELDALHDISQLCDVAASDAVDHLVVSEETEKVCARRTMCMLMRSHCRIYKASEMLHFINYYYKEINAIDDENPKDILRLFELFDEVKNGGVAF